MPLTQVVQVAFAIHSFVMVLDDIADKISKGCSLIISPPTTTGWVLSPILVFGGRAVLERSQSPALPKSCKNRDFDSRDFFAG